MIAPQTCTKNSYYYIVFEIQIFEFNQHIRSCKILSPVSKLNLVALCDIVERPGEAVMSHEGEWWEVQVRNRMYNFPDARCKYIRAGSLSWIFRYYILFYYTLASYVKRGRTMISISSEMFFILLKLIPGVPKKNQNTWHFISSEQLVHGLL